MPKSATGRDKLLAHQNTSASGLSCLYTPDAAHFMPPRDTDSHRNNNLITRISSGRNRSAVPARCEYLPYFP